jgi:phosphoglucosamine mutase
VIDGDQIMAILAVAMKRGRLKNDTLVATVMSNLGLHRAMAAQGIPSSRPPSATATCSSG